MLVGLSSVCFINCGFVLAKTSTLIAFTAVAFYRTRGSRHSSHGYVQGPAEWLNPVQHRPYRTRPSLGRSVDRVNRLSRSDATSAAGCEIRFVANIRLVCSRIPHVGLRARGCVNVSSDARVLRAVAAADHLSSPKCM